VTLTRSQFVHVLPVGNGAFICVHGLERNRLVLREEVVSVLDEFTASRNLEEWLRETSLNGRDPAVLRQCVSELLEANFLFAGSPAEERQKYTDLAAALFGSAPGAAKKFWDERWSPKNMDRYGAVTVPRDLRSFAPVERTINAVLIGFCDVHFGMDILRDQARRCGIKLVAIPTFEHDVRVVEEKPHDVIIIGALSGRHGHWYRSDAQGDFAPDRYLRIARTLVEKLRERSPAPILLNNLPLPTCSPLGIAGRGAESHRQRVRRINLDLAALSDEFPDVFIVDVDAALGFAGKASLLDDRLVPFSHVGGLGWWANLPEHELSTVHGIPQPIEALREMGVDDPFEYDRTVAEEQLSMMLTIFGINRRKCVLVDLDNTLWPGILAETGAPFPMDLDFTLFSYHSLFVGLHQALKSLKRRGILLACVSKNDEEVVRKLWRYPAGAPIDQLLTLDDFVTSRINWNEKVDNIAEIAEELSLGLESMVYLDDHPVEREKVARFLPQVLIIGKNPMAARWELLTSPYLQVPYVTEESKNRSDMTRAQVQRDRARKSMVDPVAFLSSLDLRCEVGIVSDDRELDRIHELVVRTNQFNTTTLRLSKQQLREGIADPGSRLYTLRAEDRFTPYGLVGVCLIREGEIAIFVLSCRVIGLGVENVLLRAAMSDQAAQRASVCGRFIPTQKNLPARNLFRDNGFSEIAENLWEGSTTGELAGSFEPWYAVTFGDFRTSAREPELST